MPAFSYKMSTLTASASVDGKGKRKANLFAWSAQRRTLNSVSWSLIWSLLLTRSGCTARKSSHLLESVIDLPLLISNLISLSIFIYISLKVLSVHLQKFQSCNCVCPQISATPSLFSVLSNPKTLAHLDDVTDSLTEIYTLKLLLSFTGLGFWGFT